MVRWYYSSLFDEIDDMKKQIDAFTRQMYRTSPLALLPGSGEPETSLVRAGQSGLRVDVANEDKEVVVTADLAPGLSKKDISLRLAAPDLLEISYERKEEKQEKKEGYYLRERRFGAVSRLVSLPQPVSGEGAKASLENGVLKVRLKKTEQDLTGKIPVE